MSDLQIFHNDRFGKLRSFVDEDGNLWFVAVDVCSALGLGNSRQTLSYLDDDEKGVITNDTLGGPQEMATVNEPGLYSLILRSRKAEAKAFKRWITHEVIPSIRKTGQYQIDPSRRTFTTCPGQFIDLLAYVSTLRQMARQKFYSSQEKAEFLAEAASLLSGYPASRFMPSEPLCPLFN